MSDTPDKNTPDNKDVKELDPSNLQNQDSKSEINLDDIDIKGWAKSRGKKK